MIVIPPLLPFFGQNLQRVPRLVPGAQPRRPPLAPAVSAAPRVPAAPAVPAAQAVPAVPARVTFSEETKEARHPPAGARLVFLDTDDVQVWELRVFSLLCSRAWDATVALCIIVFCGCCR